MIIYFLNDLFGYVRHTGENMPLFFPSDVIVTAEGFAVFFKHTLSILWKNTEKCG